MFVDMPPGTGDVPLTVFQSIPLDGIIIVTSPQELVSMIVAKAVNMAQMMNVPIVGIVENKMCIRDRMLTVLSWSSCTWAWRIDSIYRWQTFPADSGRRWRC